MAIRPTGYKKVLARHGRDMKVYSGSHRGNYNPETGLVEDRIYDFYNVRGYFYFNKDLSNLEGLITTGRRKLVIDAVDKSGFEYPKPKTDDKVEGQNDMVVIEVVREITSGDKTLYYICELRE